MRDKIDTKAVDIVLPEPLLWNEKNKQSLKNTLNIEYTKLKSNNNKKSAIIPINLGNAHWVSLIITKSRANDLIFTYNNPDGSPINPNLKSFLQQVAPEAPITDLETKQQWNDYDCGPIVVR
ncbi:MAG: Ulp1 family isopeptidase [Candidatus Rickettsia vulgarisii]